MKAMVYYPDDGWYEVRTDIDIDFEKDKQVKVSSTIKTSLTTAAQKEYNDAITAQTRIERELAAAKKNAQEKYSVLRWAQSLVVGADLSAPVQNIQVVGSGTPYQNTSTPELFFFRSRSGLTEGHYVRRYKNNIVDCSCPGYRARNYCWASTKVRNGEHISVLNRYFNSEGSFFLARDKAIAANPLK